MLAGAGAFWRMDAVWRLEFALGDGALAGGAGPRLHNLGGWTLVKYFPKLYFWSILLILTMLMR